ncbi:MAG TPA: hypothetical protein VGN72_08125 [Tepidisphaeraceae bacterium]|nr:hypothetical protein [Tepidisphaeraceae bacterium]
MNRVRQSAACANGVDRNPRRYWIGVAASVAVAAGMAIVVGGVSWWPTTSREPAHATTATPVISALAVPNEVTTRAARQAQDGIDSWIALADVASLDQDAIRLVDFVVDQLKVVSLPAESKNEADGSERL